MRTRTALLLLLALAGLTAQAEKKPKLEKPIAGPRAVVLRVTWLYVAPDKQSQKIDKVQIGREMVVAEHSGPWVRVHANTDIEQMHEQRDVPLVSSDDETPPPVSGWIEAKGVVQETTPNGDQILMGEAANQESLAEDPRGPVKAAESARLLYRRLVEMFPASPLVPTAAWRTADIQWQIEKSEASTRPSAHERDAYLRQQMDEGPLRKVIKQYPHTREADLAAFDLIDNKLCGNWEGAPQCPEKESEVYEKYATEHPDGPRTARALYLACYRQAVLTDMYAANDQPGRSKTSHTHAAALASKLKEHFAATDDAWRAGTLVYKLDEGIPVYGIDRE
jgi:hypothetical protein